MFKTGAIGRVDRAEEIRFPIAGHPVTQDEVLHASADIDGIDLGVSVEVQGIRNCFVRGVEAKRSTVKAPRGLWVELDRGRFHKRTVSARPVNAVEIRCEMVLVGREERRACRTRSSDAAGSERVSRACGSAVSEFCLTD